MHHFQIKTKNCQEHTLNECAHLQSCFCQDSQDQAKQLFQEMAIAHQLDKQVHLVEDAPCFALHESS